ncbi:MAG: AarF/ABC1/UbiB kinase family protein, partial [Anaerolineales bacterium]|nr:AarF/ABC1/UbiB kinase family protein [Anaerolineales bacterium]
MDDMRRNGQKPARRVQQAVAAAIARQQDEGRDLEAEMAALLWEEPAQAALQRRLNGHGPEPAGDTPTLQSLPRRRQVIDTDAGDPPIPQIEDVAITVSFWRALGRLFHWLYLIIYVVGGNTLDQLLRRNTVEREAVRLRRGLERVGGTFVKFGQQIAMRIDLVPWEYSIELSKMLDKMPPFPLAKALAAVERSTGKPWQETFAVFDPEPVGSASVACVFQAILKDGTKVAVKVRRPGIGELFVADFRVMGWLFDLVEFLTIVRPGFTLNVRTEFANTLLEELDFRKEARFQDIFRRRAKKSGKKYFSAPNVFF